MIDFLTIVLLIFGVLQIILFFKVWGMTNDVNRIKKKLEIQPEDEDNIISESQIKVLNGEKEKAFDLYQKAFYKSIIELFNKTISEYGEEEDKDDISYEARNEYYQTEYNKIVKYFIKRTNKLEIELDTVKFDSYEKVHSLICKS